MLYQAHKLKFMCSGVRNSKIHLRSITITNMNIRPLADYILIEPLKEEEKTKSGIILPETAEKEQPQEGKVVATGPGKQLKSGQRAKMEVKEGDKVLFRKYGPDEIKVDEKEYLIAKQEDILAIIK